MIKKQHFDDIFKGTENYLDVYAEITSENVTKCIQNPLWRLNNIYSVHNKEGKHVKFVMNTAQLIVYANLKRRKRLIILKSRQQGVSTLMNIIFLDMLLFTVDKKITVAIQAHTNDSATGFITTIRDIHRSLPKKFVKMTYSEILVDNKQELKLRNGNRLLSRVNLRGASLQGYHSTELAIVADENPDKAQALYSETLPAVTTDCIVVIESTAKGYNLFKHEWDKAVRNKTIDDPLRFYPVFLSWLDDPKCVNPVDQIPTKEQEALIQKFPQELTREQRNFFISYHDTLGARFFQEYPSIPEEAFFSEDDGYYYAPQFKRIQDERRIVSTKELYDPQQPLYAAMDLGFNDYTCIVVFQQPDIYKYNIIAEYTNNGEAISHYLKWLNTLKIEELPRKLTALFLPHDATHHTTTSENNIETIIKANLKSGHVIVLPKDRKLDGIDKVRRRLDNMHISEDCEYLISSIQGYKQKYDPSRGVFLGEERNKATHGADALRYVVQANPFAKFSTKSNIYNSRKTNQSKAKRKYTI